MLTNEEVLITILFLSKDTEDQAVPSADVARLMRVTRAAMHNRVIKLIERGLLEKGIRKKLCFTPDGLVYTTSLARDVFMLQSFYIKAGGLSQAEAKTCAFTMVSTLPEDTRKRLVRSINSRMAGDITLHEDTNLTEKPVPVGKKREIKVCAEDAEYIALHNETTRDEEFFSLLDELSLFEGHRSPYGLKSKKDD